MKYFLRFLIAATLFVVFWVVGRSAMEDAGVQSNAAYAAFGAIWGMLWVATLSVISD